MLLGYRLTLLEFPKLSLGVCEVLTLHYLWSLTYRQGTVYREWEGEGVGKGGEGEGEGEGEEEGEGEGEGEVRGGEGVEKS